jgi:hypothetical protein
MTSKERRDSDLTSGGGLLSRIWQHSVDLFRDFISYLADVDKIMKAIESLFSCHGDDEFVLL